MRAAAAHWDGVYASKPSDRVSWFQQDPLVSLRLLRAATQPSHSVIDVGAGTSTLPDRLLDQGWSDVTVLDVAAEALAQTRKRLGPRAEDVTFIRADLLVWRPARTFDAWHDRAVFHFLTQPADQEQYVAITAKAVTPGGVVILGTFAADGPTQCSGLPTARYDAPSLARAFSPFFRLEHSEREEHHTPTHVVQPFTWVVLRHGRPADSPSIIAPESSYTNSK